MLNLFQSNFFLAAKRYLPCVIKALTTRKECRKNNTYETETTFWRVPDILQKYVSHTSPQAWPYALWRKG